MQVITMSDKSTGRANVRKIKGIARITVTKGFNEPVNEIAVENSYRFYNGSYDERENALINITFADGKVWTGAFSDLQKKLI